MGVFRSRTYYLLGSNPKKINGFIDQIIEGLLCHDSPPLISEERLRRYEYVLREYLLIIFFIVPAVLLFLNIYLAFGSRVISRSGVMRIVVGNGCLRRGDFNGRCERRPLQSGNIVWSVEKSAVYILNRSAVTCVRAPSVS